MSDVLILVHPGSLCGSYHTSWSFDPKRFERLLVEIADWIANPETRVGVVAGELDDGLDRADPRLRIAVRSARAEVFGDATEEDLGRAARALVRTMRLRPNDDILVSGAWADPGDGCLTRVATELARVLNSGRVRISALAPAAFELPVSFRVVPSVERDPAGKLLRHAAARTSNLPKRALQLHEESLVLDAAAADEANAFNVLAQHHSPPGYDIQPHEVWQRCGGPFPTAADASKVCSAFQRSFFRRSDTLAAELGIVGFRVQVGPGVRVAPHCYTTRSAAGLRGHCELRLEASNGPTIATAAVGAGPAAWVCEAGEWAHPDMTAALRAQALDFASRALKSEEFRAARPVAAPADPEEEDSEQLAA